jgi:SAM-dependent methyltransferase
MGCRVVGVDVMEEMVELAQARAEREEVSGRTTFRVADARRLPFEDGSFDAVLCESVATFVAEKEQVIGELARVVRAGGCVGLNEEVWLQPPPEGMVDFARRYWQVEGQILTADEWTALMEGAGLGDREGERLYLQVYRVDPRREASQVKRYHLSDFWRMIRRTVGLYLKSPAFRDYLRAEGRMPRDMFDYLGYVVAVGRKRSGNQRSWEGL